MVQPAEAKGRKSICRLADCPDWQAAQDRCAEIGIPIVYTKAGRPVVNIDLFNRASQRWYMKKRKNKAD